MQDKIRWPVANLGRLNLLDFEVGLLADQLSQFLAP